MEILQGIDLSLVSQYIDIQVVLILNVVAQFLKEGFRYLSTKFNVTSLNWLIPYTLITISIGISFYLLDYSLVETLVRGLVNALAAISGYNVFKQTKKGVDTVKEIKAKTKNGKDVTIPNPDQDTSGHQEKTDSGERFR